MCWGRDIFFRRHGIQHMQKIGMVAQIVARINIRLANRFFVGKCGNGFGLGQQADDVQVNIFPVAAFGIITGK